VREAGKPTAPGIAASGRIVVELTGQLDVPSTVFCKVKVTRFVAKVTT